MKFVQLSDGRLVNVDAVAMLQPWYSEYDPGYMFLVGGSYNHPLRSKADYDMLREAIERQGLL